MVKKGYQLLSLLLALLLLVGCGKMELTWQEQYDLGLRYLSEGNYEEAILAFNAVIEIDPKRPEAYVQLAEIYTELGDEEKLSEIMDMAAEQFGEEEFMKLLQEEMEAPGEPENNPPENETQEPFVVEEIYRYEGNYHCFHLPRLNLPEGLGQEFNGQMQEKSASYREFYMFAAGSNFDWYRYEDTIVILLQEYGNAPAVHKFAYTISAETGKELTKAEILARYEISEAEFEAKVREYMDEYLQKTVWELTNSQIESNPEFAEMYKQEANWAVAEAYSEENMKAVKPYVGKDGELCFVFYVPGVVQHDDWFLINFNTGETYSIPRCDAVHDAT